jgi:hypothetical protein
MSAAIAVDLGYQFAPPARPEHPGYRRLRVWLRAEPTERHYDPESVTCEVVAPAGEVDVMTFEHPWPFGRHYRSGPGRIELNDRKHKRVEGYTFGAEVEVESEPELTCCTFDSPVPIFALLEPDSLGSRFAAEVEVVIAQQRAQWDSSRAGRDFDAQLGTIGPLALYRACLEEVAARLVPLAHVDRPAQEVLHFITQERGELEAQRLTPGPSPSLAELLARDTPINK